MKKTWVKILVIALAAAVLAIAAAVVIDINASRSGYIGRTEHSLTYFYADAEGATRFFCDSALLTESIAGHVDSFLSCDGTVGIARAGTGLFRISSEGILRIYSAGVDRAALSLNNNVIVFTTATQVHIYDHSTGETVDIKPEGAAGVPSIAISEDGKTVAYTVKKADGSYELYSYINNSSEKLADNAYVLAVSDGAKSLYYIEPDTASLVYKKGGSAKRIAQNVSGLVEFNKDLTEAIFDISGVTYYSVRGSKASVLVEDASVYCTKPECASTQGGEQATGSVADVSSLFGAVYYSTFSSSTDQSARKAYNLYYVDRFKHVTQLAKGAYEFRLSKDGSILSCLIDNDLYTMSPSNPGTAQKLAANVYSSNMTRDGKTFYCVGVGLGLYCITGSSASAELAQNAVYSVLTEEGRCLFLTDYETTGTLNIAEGYNTPRELMGNVAHVEVKPGVCFCYSGFYDNEYGTEVYDVYVSTDGEEFTLALAGAAMSSDKN